MKNKFLLRMLFLFLLVFAISQKSQAQYDLNLDGPPEEISPNIRGVSYGEGWWEVRPGADLTYSSDAGGFIAYNQGFLRLNNRVVTDVNPNARSCVVLQTAEIYNTVSAAVISSRIGSGVNQLNYQTTASVDLDPQSFGISFGPSPLGIRWRTTVQCALQAPSTTEEFGGGYGVSGMRYDFQSVLQPGRYLYKHMPGHEIECPAFCGRIPRDEFVSYTSEPPSPHIRIWVPYGPYGCLNFGGVYSKNATPVACFDVGWN